MSFRVGLGDFGEKLGERERERPREESSSVPWEASVLAPVEVLLVVLALFELPLETLELFCSVFCPVPPEPLELLCAVLCSVLPSVFRSSRICPLSGFGLDSFFSSCVVELRCAVRALATARG